MAYNALFIVGFLTAFIWASCAASAVSHFLKDSTLSRFIALPLWFIAIQSILWGVLLTLSPIVTFGSSSFATGWLWLMNGSAVTWWICSLLGLLAGFAYMAYEGKDSKDGLPETVIVACVATLGFGLVFFLWGILMGIVASIQALG